MTNASLEAAQPDPVTTRHRQIAWWLVAMCGLVALMVIVGGATRLTESGLSITEWKPVTGAVPPLSAADWASEFEKYKQIPEYQLINKGMSLDEFKTIYWWEWGHRFLGRLIGLAFLIPLLVFLALGGVNRRLGLVLFSLFVLGGAQGALGWFMVKSGLTERVDVSQYRLAAHLGLAVFLFAAMMWTAFELRLGGWFRSGAALSWRLSPLAKGAFALSLGVYAQMILGAFVAGLKAGRTYTTWPLMDGRFLPEAYFHAAPRFGDLFESIAAVQFNHRIGAYLLLGAGVWFYLAARRNGFEARARWVLIAIGGQALLGIATLLSATPISLGLLHQAGALVVLTLALYAAHGLATSKSSSKLSSG